MADKTDHRFKIIQISLLLFILVSIPCFVYADDDDDDEDVKPIQTSITTDVLRYKVEDVGPIRPAVLALLSRGWTVDTFDKTHVIGTYARDSDLSRVQIDYADLEKITFHYIDPAKEKNLEYLRNLSRDFLGGYLSCRFLKR